MNQKFRYFLFLFLCFSLNTSLNAQTQNDSLAKYSYEELRLFYKKNNSQDTIYVKEYLERAKRDNDTIKVARGYYNMAVKYEDLTTKINYIDSSITICENCRHSTYPVLSYYFKGAYLFSLGENKRALINFLKALKVLEKNKNVSLELDVRNSIIALKTNWLANQETLDFTKESLEFVINNKNEISNYNITYFTILHNLSVSLIRNKKFTKALKIAQKGIEETINTDYTSDYNDFISLSGIAKYFIEDYQTAIDSLQKALPYRSDHGKAMSNYYLGKSYDKLNQPEKAHDHFLKVDFLYVKTQDLFPELRNTYEHIVEYYKEKGDTEQQLFFLERLIETDAKIDSVYKYVNETIQKKYDTPQAITERNRLLKEAQANENSWKYSFGIISAILAAIIGVLFYVYRRQKYYKQRFENVMSKSSGTEKSISTALDVTQEKENTQSKDIGISETIVKSILKGLSKFEASEGYRKQITLTELAKNLETNPKYLSKVINWHYQKNFSSYINELRVQYTISKLKEDSKFRNYTIKAIAKEVGFKGTESFSKSFYKVTQIYPSYFIKQLQKRQHS
ncbi:helix-turn-helix domain-containing protein [Kordia jejudonensis]|uniref:helix-turn-helix domain-containing protein n=1 Tax=Kordia jejudonensis TaxID=1348245 RepID=UPI0009E610AF|nr:helix-turn-helix domain-containing protein [Kordia jejudonensis]